MYATLPHTQDSPLDLNLLKTSQVEPSKPSILFQ